MARVHRKKGAPGPRVLESDPHRHGHRSAYQLEGDRQPCGRGQYWIVES
jgi:hypothetical protein